VVEDHLKHRFWKIGQLEYELCSVLNGERSIPAAAALLAGTSKLGRAAGADKLTAIGMWLLQLGLVETAGHIPIQNELESQKTPTPNPVRWFDPSFFRIPVLSSDVIDRFASGLTWLISIPCLAAALAVWCIAGVTAYQNSAQLIAMGAKLFVPGSQWWLLIAWLLLKAVHESGHAIANTKVGAKSSGAGIGFMFFAPSPYVDVTGLWSVPNRWSRVLVSCAGMAFEITVAAIAVICACSFDNSSIKYLCFSIASLGTFTTIAFNGNPLMRYDGYYVLVDLIDRPNLWQDASQSMKAYFSTWIFKGHGEQFWSIPLLVYGVSCWISRALLMSAMGWGMWLTWDGAGLMVVAFFMCLWLVVPQIRRFQAGTKSAESFSIRGLLSTICPRKAARCFVCVGLLSLFGLLPSPVQIYWPAIIEYVDPSDVRTNVAGFVVEVFVHDGQGVREGDEIIRLSNPDLELECQNAQSQLQLSQEKCIAFRAQHKHSELQAEEALQESLLVKAESLTTKVNALRVKAPRDGVLIARTSRNLPGSFVPEGQPIGLVVNPSKIEVNASIPQYAWETVARNVDAPVSIHMLNGDKWLGKIRQTLPRTTDVLDSPSLGGLYGGPIAVVQSKNASGDTQLKSYAPRLQTRIDLNESLPRGSWIAFEVSGQRPPPGALCSVKLKLENENVWQTAYRWTKAGFQKHFHEKG
jgi:putative peptide zinc metalloprotease protein